MKKLIILLLSLAYCLYLSSILVADINLSIHLNPLNSDYYYQKYSLLKAQPAQALTYLQSAIELEPTRAAYHMFYALALLKLTPIVHHPSSIVHQAVILQELHRAVSLKPFSKLYQKTLHDYLPSLQP